MTLNENATVRDILNSLRDPEEYVRGVLGNMVDYKNRRGSVLFRMGISGEGVIPNYRLQVTDSKLDEVSGVFSPDSDVFEAYSGQTHRRLNWTIQEMLASRSWSNHFQTREDIMMLLGEIRGVGRPGAANRH